MIRRAVILSTGDELISGRVVDTNSATIAGRLASIGIEVVAVLKVGDDRERLLWALRQGRILAELIIGTGGLGPTADDLTAEVVAQFLGRKLQQDDQVAQALVNRFEARRVTWTANNLKQALFPEESIIIPNPIGTAPGFRLSLGKNKTLVWLSGVPQEMEAGLTATVIPWIIEQGSQDEQISGCTFRVCGLTESKLDDLLKPIELGSQARLSFRANFPDLSVHLTAKGGAAGKEIFARLREQIRGLLGNYIYSEDDASLEEVIGSLLLSKNQSLALAESCTGGYISHRITSVPGSSAYYYGGAVSYSNEAKFKFLGVRPQTVTAYGAVSRETVLEMSQGIREKTGATIGLGVTGIAGPSGGTPEKPVGTVWLSIAQDNRHEARHLQFHGDRGRIILGTSQAALYWLRSTLMEEI